MVFSGLYFADGNLYVTSAVPPIAGDVFKDGLRYSAASALYYTTTLSASDIYIGGVRVSILGQVVCGPTPAA